MAEGAPAAVTTSPAIGDEAASGAVERCLIAGGTGGAIGVLLGGGFHLVSGYGLRAAGRSIPHATILKEAGQAVFRFGGVLGLFAATRCAAEAALRAASGEAAAPPPGTPSRLLPSMIAGAVAVAIPTAFVPDRQQFLRAYYASLLKRDKKGIGLGLILASSALSGGVTLGGGDYLLRRLGVIWS